jgi:hypothetical protein
MVILMAEQPTYNAGENVLCYHGPLIYLAKVLKVQPPAEGDEKNAVTGKEGQHYFVHYKGWKTTLVSVLSRAQAHADSVLGGTSGCPRTGC